MHESSVGMLIGLIGLPPTRHGGRITLGSDFPVESIDPLKGFYAAVSRRSEDGKSPMGPDGWYVRSTCRLLTLAEHDCESVQVPGSEALTRGSPTRHDNRWYVTLHTNPAIQIADNHIAHV